MSLFFLFSENDRILILIKGSIIVPEDIEFSSIENILLDNVNEKIETLNLEFKHLGHCEIQSIEPEEKDMRVIFKTKDCLQYSGLFAEKGIIVSFLKTFLRCEDAEDNPYLNVRMMRIGLIANTTLIQQKLKRGKSSEYLYIKKTNCLTVNTYMYVDYEKDCRFPHVFFF